MSYCRNCGNELPVNAKFCGKCGKAVEEHKSEKVENSIQDKSYSVEKISETEEILSDKEVKESISDELYIKSNNKKRLVFKHIIGGVILIMIFVCISFAVMNMNVFNNHNLEHEEYGTKEQDEIVYRVIKEEYENFEDSSNNYMYEHKYDEKGNETSVIKYDGNGEVIDSSKIEREYDKSGNIIGEKHYDKDGKLKMSIESSFDENGNVKTRKVYDDKNEFLSHIEWEYDKKGKMTGEKTYDENNQVTIFCELKYASNGIIIRKEYNSSGQLLDNIEYQYDEDGNCIYSKWYLENGDISEKQYDNKGHTINSKHYEGDELISGSEYEYDEKGNCILEKCYSAGMTKTYDDNGNLIGEKRNEYKLFMTIERNYDDKSKLTSQNFFNNADELYARHEFLYDSNGNMVSSKSYDETGKLESASTYTHKSFEVIKKN